MSVIINPSAAGGGAGTNTLGMSNIGNTSGTTGVVTGTAIQYLFAGGNNVTLSQSLAAGNASGTITISAFNQSVQTQNLVDITLAGNSTSAGAGFILMSSGTVTLAGGNNITLSQNGNAVTISAFTQTAGSQSIGVSNVGNTSGTSGMASGNQVLYVIDASAGLIGSQSLNGASGTLTLLNSWSTGTTVSSVTSANAVGANAGRFAMEGHQHGGVGPAGVSNVGNTSGNTTILQGQLVFAGGNNITLSQSTSNNNNMTITVSGGNSFSAGISTAGATSGNTGLVSQQLLLVGSVGIGLSGSTNAGSATVSIEDSPYYSNWYPFIPTNTIQVSNAQNQPQFYPFWVKNPVTATRCNHLMSCTLSTSSNSSHAGTLSLWIGVYTRNASTLSLASSGSQTYVWTNTSNNSTSVLQGVKQVSVPLNVNLTAGEYYLMVMDATSSANTNWFSFSNQMYGNFNAGPVSGDFGSSFNNTQQVIPGMGFYSNTTNAIPASVAFTQIQGNQGPRMPEVYFMNVTF